MKLIPLFSSILIISYCLTSAAAPLDEAALENEARQVSFAERVISIELARALSISTREARAKCSDVCPETGALELGIGLIGLSQSSTGSTALVNLLGLRLDGAGSEELNCQILTRGKALELGQVQAKQAVEHCRRVFLDLKKRELMNVSDVSVEQVCRSESEVSSAQGELLKAIRSNVMCEQ